MPRKQRAIITALPEKASEMREIANKLEFTYKEFILEPEGFIKFIFNLTDEEQFRLIKNVPIEIYAFRMQI